MKRLLALVIPIVTTLFMAQSALAAGPTIIRYPKQSYDFVDSTCGFDVHIQGTASEVDVLWDGVRLIQAYPQSNEVLTNVQTGRTIHQNLAGGDQITVNKDGSFTFVGTGNWGWPYNPYTGELGAFVTSGRFVESGDPQGNITFTIVGEVEDLCAELAA
jgi:hypothetical protein